MLVSTRGVASIVVSPPELGVVVVIFNCLRAVFAFEGGQATHGDFFGLMRFVARVFTRLSDILTNPWLLEHAETNLTVVTVCLNRREAQGQCPTTEQSLFLPSEN